VTGNKRIGVPELYDVGSYEHGLDGPLGQLAGVVLQLVGQDGTALRVQLLAPVDIAGVARVPFVQRLDVHELEKDLERLTFKLLKSNL
jgi:hypothetical protein